MGLNRASPAFKDPSDGTGGQSETERNGMTTLINGSWPWALLTHQTLPTDAAQIDAMFGVSATRLGQVYVDREFRRRWAEDGEHHIAP